MLVRSEEKLNIRLINRFLSIFLPIAIIYLVTNILQDWNAAPVISKIFNLLNPIIIALVITWILNPFVKFLESKDIRKGLATFIAFFAFFLVFYFIFSLFIPVLVKQLSELVDYAPQLQTGVVDFGEKFLDNLRNSYPDLDYDSLSEQFTEAMSSITSDMSSYLKTISSGIYDIFSSFLGAVLNIFFAVMISFYLLYDYDNIMDAIVKVFPKRHQNAIGFMINEFTAIVGNYIRSYTVISMIVTVLVYICFGLLGLSSPLVLALFVGIFNFVPMIGPFIGAVPALLVALSMNLTTAVITIVLITVVQQIDANILKPLLMGRSTNLHPLVIVISIMAFGKFFGIIGILVAIPVTAFFNSLLNFLASKGYTFARLFDFR